MIRSGGARRDRLQRGVPAADDLRLGLAAALEGVLDQAGDVLLVFDDEDTVPGHKERAPRRRARNAALSVGEAITSRMPGAAVATVRDLRRGALQLTVSGGRFAPVSKC